VHAITRPPLTEDALIAAISDAVGAPARPLRVGIGDDAAVWQPKRHHLALVTTDLLIDGVHFRLDNTPPESLGRKALAENLSDIAAMGGAPTVAVVGLGLTPAIDEAWIRQFYRGMSALASSSRCAIAGGDIVRSPALTIAVSVVGEVRKTSMRLRSGARAGDISAVSGPLGLAAAGLKLIDAGKREGAAVARYLSPDPRLAEGKFLGSRRAVHAMMDVSDGLSTDIARMARASGVDAIVIRDQLFVHPALAGARIDPIDAILNGGDDYELLIAIERRSFAFIARTFERRFGRPLCAVGRFEKGEGNLWFESSGERTRLEPRGYDHLGR
jgi:thiamine-monophosphate kinase